MAKIFAPTLERIIRQCHTFLSNTEVLRYNIYDDYAVLRIEGEYENYLIRVREVVRLDGSRKYSYYIFDNKHQVVAGFDNASDPKSLYLKYGQNYSQHRLEAIPHYHTFGKQSLELTDEMSVEVFFEWIRQNL